MKKSKNIIQISLLIIGLSIINLNYCFGQDDVLQGAGGYMSDGGKVTAKSGGDQVGGDVIIQGGGAYGLGGDVLIDGGDANGTDGKVIIQGDNEFLPGGHVGIGCNPSTTTFKVYKASTPTFELASSVSRLQIGAATYNGAFAGGAKAGDIVFRQLGGPNNTNNMVFYIPNNNNDGNSYIKFGDSSNNLWMGIFNDKTVRIDGKLYAQEIQVQTDVWSDFVFKPDYKLKTLEEVENFIKENKHLPDVPNEATIIEDGINVAEMNAILLQKIEELTLYTIAQEKQINRRNQDIEELKKQNKEILELLKTSN